MLHVQNSLTLITSPCASVQSQGQMAPVVKVAHALDLKKAQRTQNC